MNGEPGLLNVIDVEATCWPGTPPPGQVSEIIEIGLTVVNLATAQRLRKHRILVRPRQSAVSEFCTELTGLTQTEVDTGVDFAEACALLATEHAAAERAWTSWGDYDRKQFHRQCTPTASPSGSRQTNAHPLNPHHTATQPLSPPHTAAHRLSPPHTAAYPLSPRHTNAKAVFTTAFGLRRPAGMARALEIAGLPLQGRHHRGDDDSWNIAALVLCLLGRGAWPGAPAGQ
ncbi:exonuclease domain-containing protein [Crossiella sp. CA198]|uniref:exonuclease domain-containing protein n=1 Tax=Crossiella sp. CA198 TaxID=3455607 RepID=UPI003F8D59EA